MVSDLLSHYGGGSPFTECLRWYHVAVTYDGSEVAIYIDSKKENSTAASGSIDTFNANLDIGRDTAFSYSGEAFDGYIDDVRIYNRGLSASEVRQLFFYREHRPTFTPSTCSNPTGSAGDMVYNTDDSDLLYINKTAITGFSNSYYWSSSEYGATSGAWFQGFLYGTIGADNKDTFRYVRCVRR